MMIIKSHTQLSDDEFESQFESLKFKPGLFSHEAHLRLAYIHITKYGQAQAEKNMCEQIQAFGKKHGSDGFNWTVTIAAVRALNHFIKKSETTSFEDLIKEFPRLLTNFKDLLGQHYGFNVFADKRAKAEYIEPDLLPFD